MFIPLCAIGWSEFCDCGISCHIHSLVLNVHKLLSFGDFFFALVYQLKPDSLTCISTIMSTTELNNQNLMDKCIALGITDQSETWFKFTCTVSHELTLPSRSVLYCQAIT